MPKILLSKSTLIGAALLLSTTALGVTLAAARDRHDQHGQAYAGASESADGHLRVASEHGMRQHDEGHHRRHSDDDDDDEEGDDGGRVAPSQPLPSGPGVPAPDNGLFNGKSKPKVDVQ